jgi:PadR family transcriptional regulator PadR
LEKLRRRWAFRFEGQFEMADELFLEKQREDLVGLFSENSPLSRLHIDRFDHGYFHLDNTAENMYSENQNTFSEDMIMDELTKMEKTVLIAIWRLRGKAYGYAIRKFMIQELQKEISLGNLYSVLYQIHKKGYIQKSIGEQTQPRGGKRKIYYSILPTGMDALRRAYESDERLWKAIPRNALLAKAE